MRSEELSQSACLFLLQETWLVQSQGHGLTLEAVLAKRVKGAAPHKEMKRMYGFKRASLGRNHAAEPLCEIRPMIFLKIEKLSNE